METPSESEGGVSRGEPKGTEGGISMNPNESFYEIPDERTTQHSLRFVSQQILQWTGVTPEWVIRVNPFDTVVEVAAEVPIVAVTQQLHLIHEWGEIPMNVSCIMGKKEYIMDMVRCSSEMIEQRGEAEKEIQCA